MIINELSITLHPALAVGAGAGAAVFALGGVDVVAYGELDSLVVHVVGLRDGVAAEVCVYVEVSHTGKVCAFKAEDQGAVVQECFLDGPFLLMIKQKKNRLQTNCEK